MSDLNAAPTAPNDRGSEKRRSLRVHIAIPVLVRGGGNGKPSFEEGTSTVLVSAHGCMMRLANRVERNQQITIINKKTAEELVCSVTFLGQIEDGKMEVGLQFAEPSPVFWRIAFPPENWDPSERKRPQGQRSSSEPGK